MSDFNTSLSRLCQKALKEAGEDREAQAEIIERLINATAFTIAITCKGDTKTMDTLLAGAEQQLYEAAAGHKEFGALMARL